LPWDKRQASGEGASRTAKLKLTYFDFHGGRGEPARIALSIGGIPFEDERVKGTDWERRKPGTPFGALPLLEKDGEILAQSNAINRYVGRLTNLYPSDPWQAALCDEIMEAVEDITNKIAATMFLSDEQKKVQRKELVEGPLPFYLARLQQRLEAHGGRYFAGGKLSVADLKVFVLIRQLKSGVLDHVPADLPDRIAPKLVEHYERIKNEPGVKAYYAKHSVAT
jgi:prostaglandin-H2 D-isomerase / glutathione transferase